VRGIYDRIENKASRAPFNRNFRLTRPCDLSLEKYRFSYLA
jgi:hypothetical protein